MSDESIGTCEQALRLLALYLDGELGETAHHSVEAHLRKCRSCYSRAEFERGLKEQLGGLRREEIRPVFRQRIRELIAQFTTTSADDPGA